MAGRDRRVTCPGSPGEIAPLESTQPVRVACKQGDRAELAVYQTNHDLMADLEPISHPAKAAPLPPTEGASTPPPEPMPMTSAQADQILAELKTIKQNLLWLLLIGGFFAARSFFFHY
ncbi:hypothetical protein RRF56_10895 [Nodosilinea sp. E11]|nr:hypothetical protein RRF56_10895 [Nodosilinea sp. E11]